MRVWPWGRRDEDDEIEITKRQVERTAEVIERQREQVDQVVRAHSEELEVNHLAERVRWALRGNPR